MGVARKNLPRRSESDTLACLRPLTRNHALFAIFISYRREDSEDAARALYESLVQRFGKERLFMDVEAIGLGLDFRDAIEHSLASCGVFLAMIGPGWLNARAGADSSNQRRLDNSSDYVRHELATALKKGRDLPVIPVLVNEARMPSADQLPDDLKELAYRNALTLGHLDWDGNVNRLVNAIRPYIGEPVVHSEPPPEATPKTHISVTFKIVTADQLRKIIFTLTKVSDAKNDSWSVMFELDERADATKDFNMVIQLQVDVGHNDPGANAQAAATAKHGMDADQREQALVAGDTAKDAKTGNGGVTVDDAKQDAVAVVTSRNPNSPA